MNKNDTLGTVDNIKVGANICTFFMGKIKVQI